MRTYPGKAAIDADPISTGEGRRFRTIPSGP